MERNKPMQMFESGQVLIDTNILVYAWDASDSRRQDKCIEVLQSYAGRSALSVQNLNEFSAVMLRAGVEPKKIRQRVERFASLMKVYVPESADTLHALHMVELRQMSFWDALLWAVAKSNHVSAILSEDGPTGERVDGVLYINPLQD